MSQARIRRKTFFGIAALLLFFGLVYLVLKSQREASLELRPFTVKLHFSDEVKRRIAETRAALSVRAIVTDEASGTTGMSGAVLDHREQLLSPGQDSVTFDVKHVDFESGMKSTRLEPTLTLEVITRLDQPAGNCIHCVAPVIKTSTLKENENTVDVQCNGWLSIGICVKRRS